MRTVKDILRRFKTWVHEPVEIHIWNPHQKKVVAQSELPTFQLSGRILTEEIPRTIQEHGSSALVTLNPEWVGYLCQNNGRESQHHLLIDNEGQYAILIKGAKPQ